MEKRREIQIDEIKEWKEDNICIRIRGEDLKFQTSEWAVALFIDEDEAEKIVFHLETILQERNRKKELTKV